MNVSLFSVWRVFPSYEPGINCIIPGQSRRVRFIDRPHNSLKPKVLFTRLRYTLLAVFFFSFFKYSLGLASSKNDVLRSGVFATRHFRTTSCLSISTYRLDFLKCPSSYFARSAASRPKQRALCGLTYSTLKFMRSTCGKSTYRPARKPLFYKSVKWSDNPLIFFLRRKLSLSVPIDSISNLLCAPFFIPIFLALNFRSPTEFGRKTF